MVVDMVLVVVVVVVVVASFTLLTSATPRNCEQVPGTKDVPLWDSAQIGDAASIKVGLAVTVILVDILT